MDGGDHKTFVADMAELKKNCPPNFKAAFYRLGQSLTFANAIFSIQTQKSEEEDESDSEIDDTESDEEVHLSLDDDDDSQSNDIELVHSQSLAEKGF
jgi:hypothetical protein